MKNKSIVGICLVCLILVSVSFFNARYTADRFVCQTVMKTMPNRKTLVVLWPSSSRKFGIVGFLPRWGFRYYGNAFDELSVVVEVSFFCNRVTSCSIPEIDRVIDAPKNERDKVWKEILR